MLRPEDFDLLGKTATKCDACNGLGTNQIPCDLCGGLRKAEKVKIRRYNWSKFEKWFRLKETGSAKERRTANRSLFQKWFFGSNQKILYKEWAKDREKGRDFDGEYVEIKCPAKHNRNCPECKGSGYKIRITKYSSGGGGATLKGSIGHDELNVRTRRHSVWLAYCSIIFSKIKLKQSKEMAA